MPAIAAPSAIALQDGEGERIQFGGVEIVFKSPQAGEEGWTVLDYTLPAHQAGAMPHYHDKLIETFFILNGEIWFRIGDQEVTLRQGGFAFVPAGTLHAFGNRSDSPARMLAHASHSAHKQFLCELFELVQNEPVWPPKDPGKIVELGRRYDTYYL